LTRGESASVVEICAGAGGQALGLHLAGFEHALAVELDPTAAQTLEVNLHRVSPSTVPPRVAVGDVASDDVWRPADYEGVDLLAGGVPCPPFSVAGKQLGAEDERDLFAWAVETTALVRPKALLLENVRGLMGSRFAGYRQAVLDRLQSFGYLAEWRLVEARDFGVPQLRPRTVLIALLPEYAPYFQWPDPTPTDETVGSVLIDLMSAGGWAGAEAWARRASTVAPTIVGGSKKHGGADLGPTRAKAAWRAIGVDAHGVADAAPPASAPGNHLPRLTNEMVARLQGWRGDEYAWHFTGRKTSVYRQIGNAFPPPVARAIGSRILSALRREEEAAVAFGETVEHDPVYKVLSRNSRGISVGDILAELGGRWTAEQVEDRLSLLTRDFDIHVDAGPEPLYRIARFRAFRGEPDHVRHARFASARTRVS
jgi:DNA (cytosine-5)-methyltransferase 1